MFHLINKNKHKMTKTKTKTKVTLRRPTLRATHRMLHKKKKKNIPRAKAAALDLSGMSKG
jgi:hypothetical protein